MSIMRGQSNLSWARTELAVDVQHSGYAYCPVLIMSSLDIMSLAEVIEAVTFAARLLRREY